MQGISTVVCDGKHKLTPVSESTGSSLQPSSMFSRFNTSCEFLHSVVGCELSPPIMYIFLLLSFAWAFILTSLRTKGKSSHSSLPKLKDTQLLALWLLLSVPPHTRVCVGLIWMLTWPVRGFFRSGMGNCFEGQLWISVTWVEGSFDPPILIVRVE